MSWTARNAATMDLGAAEDKQRSKKDDKTKV